MSTISSAYNIEDQERMSRAKNYFVWQNRVITRELGARVLEVGCGIGNFTATILDRKAIMGVDVDATCIARFRQRFADYPHVRARACDVNSDDFLVLREFGADCCVALNVLEHIEDDRGAISRMAAVVEPGGVIVLLVPAFTALYGPIDRCLGHHRRYTARSIREIAALLGLQVTKMRFLNLFGFFAWWTNARILRLEAQSQRQIDLFDRWIVPLMSRVEDRIYPPFGQSLCAVLRIP